MAVAGWMGRLHAPLPFRFWDQTVASLWRNMAFCELDIKTMELGGGVTSFDEVHVELHYICSSTGISVPETVDAKTGGLVSQLLPF